jgi:MFS family permease
VVLVLAALAMVGTLPGRTQGLGLVTEPLLADLGIDRVTYATLNFWATIIGAAGALGVGRLLDRFGSRVVLAAVALALGGVVCLMSRVTSFAMLAASVTLTRGLGQSALSVVSIAMVGRWFVRRVDAAMAAYSVLLSVGFMIAFPAVGAIVQRSGWRFAWLVIGVALVAVLAPLAALHPGRAAEASRTPDAATDIAHGLESPAAVLDGRTWTEAIRMPAFWVFAAGAALYGLMASGIGLFNESILAERGFGPGVYYQTLAVTAITALAGNFLGGWLATRVALTRLMAVALFILAGGVAALPLLTSLPQIMAWAVAMGLGGGLVMVLFFSVWPRVFGRRHLGRIQGIAQAMTVLASAVGPLLLAWTVRVTGSYASAFYALGAIIAATGVCGLAVEKNPEVRRGLPQRTSRD